MKRIVAIVVLGSFVMNCGLRISKKPPPEQTQRLPVQSENVAGTIVIDAEKREESGLFPGIEGFKEARFRIFSSGAYNVEIITENERLLSVNSDQRAATILLDYIDNYERIADARTQWEAKWGIIDYDTLAFPITKYEVDRALDPVHAIGCGIGSGCVTGLVIPGVIAGILSLASEDGSAIGGAELSLLATGGAVVAGSITGCLVGKAVARSDRKAALYAIKEGRKPQPLE